MKKVLVLTAVVLGLAMAAQADVYIDFNDVAVVSGADTSGRYWNATDADAVGYALTDMVDKNNNATSVDLNVLSQFYSVGSWGTTTSSIVDWDRPVTDDSVFLSASHKTAQFRIEGLSAGSSYDLTFYGARWVGGSTSTGRIMEVTIGTTMQSYHSLGEGVTTFTDVVADGSGYITIDFSSENDAVYYAHLGGMSITPEPATMSLLGIGGLLALVRKRR